MDNLTHTLVGAALAQTGLKDRTALGAATLMIGANFPDIDVIAVPLGYGIEWRRGTTHGIPAHFILPFVLAGIMWLWDRHVRRRRNPTATPADFRQLTILSAVAIFTHPALDYMNSYGMRWLMPFVDKWFYADGLFIVDVWILLTLILALVFVRFTHSTRPARIALLAVAAYTICMLGVTSLGRTQVAAMHPNTRFMVSPTELVPWKRYVTLDEANGYRFGTYSVFGGVRMSPSMLAKGDGHPSVAAARQHPRARGFLGWARFPFYRIERDGNATVVRIADARYVGDDGRGWASVEVRLP